MIDGQAQAALSAIMHSASELEAALRSQSSAPVIEQARLRDDATAAAAIHAFSC